MIPSTIFHSFIHELHDGALCFLSLLFVTHGGRCFFDDMVGGWEDKGERHKNLSELRSFFCTSLLNQPSVQKLAKPGQTQAGVTPAVVP